MLFCNIYFVILLLYKVILFSRFEKQKRNNRNPEAAI